MVRRTQGGRNRRGFGGWRDVAAQHEQSGSFRCTMIVKPDAPRRTIWRKVACPVTEAGYPVSVRDPYVFEEKRFRIGIPETSGRF